MGKRLKKIEEIYQISIKDLIFVDIFNSYILLTNFEIFIVNDEYTTT